jgi:hypothetical protein
LIITARAEPLFFLHSQEISAAEFVQRFGRCEELKFEQTGNDETH